MEQAGAKPPTTLLDHSGVGRKTLWAIRAVVIAVFGPWAYATLTWPDMPVWAVALPLGLGALVYAGSVRAAAAVGGGNSRLDGETVRFVADDHYITRARLWGLRITAAVLVLGSGGLVSLARPYASAGAVLGVVVLYWAAIQALSSPK